MGMFDNVQVDFGCGPVFDQSDEAVDSAMSQ